VSALNLYSSYELPPALAGGTKGMEDSGFSQTSEKAFFQNASAKAMRKGSFSSLAKACQCLLSRVLQLKREAIHSKRKAGHKAIN
jgi:hypothetical protein